MSSFTSALIVKRLATLRDWEVVETFHYAVGEQNSGFVIIVPKGFVTDFASIPRILWMVWPPQGGAYDKAAVIHDFLYRTQAPYLSRAVADAIFLDAMRSLCVPLQDRTFIYLGVRLFGWLTYRRYNKAVEKAPIPSVAIVTNVITILPEVSPTAGGTK